jgi:hypothetical protein
MLEMPIPSCPICGRELRYYELCRHRYYTCVNPDHREYFGIKGDNHWFTVREIDLVTGEISAKRIRTQPKPKGTTWEDMEDVEVHIGGRKEEG